MNRFLWMILQVIIFLFHSVSFLVKSLINLIISYVPSQSSQKRRPKGQQQTRNKNTNRQRNVITTSNNYHHHHHQQQQLYCNNGKGATRKSDGNYYVESNRRQYINHTLTYRRKYWPLRPSKNHQLYKKSMQVNCGKSSPSNQWFINITREWAGFMTPIVWISLIGLLIVFFPLLDNLIFGQSP